MKNQKTVKAVSNIENFVAECERLGFTTNVQPKREFPPIPAKPEKEPHCPEHLIGTMPYSGHPALKRYLDEWFAKLIPAAQASLFDLAVERLVKEGYPCRPIHPEDIHEEILKRLLYKLIWLHPGIQQPMPTAKYHDKIKAIIDAQYIGARRILGFLDGKLVLCLENSLKPVSLAESVKWYEKLEAWWEDSCDCDEPTKAKWLKMIAAALQGK